VRAPERHRWKSESHAGGGLVEHKPVRASLRVPAAGGSLALSNVDETLTAMQSSQELPETSRSLPDAWETAVHHLQEALLERRHPTQHSTVERQQLKDALRWLVSTSQRASVPFCRYAVLFLKEFVREQVWEALLEPVLGCTHSTCAPWNDSRKRLTGTADWDTPTSFDPAATRACIAEAAELLEQALQVMDVVAERLDPSRRLYWRGALSVDAQAVILQQVTQTAMRRLVRSMFVWALQDAEEQVVTGNSDELGHVPSQYDSLRAQQRHLRSEGDCAQAVPLLLADLERQLAVLGLLDQWRDLVVVQIYESIEERAYRLARDELHEGVLDDLLAWVQKLLQPWVAVMPLDPPDAEISMREGVQSTSGSAFERKVGYFTHETLLHARLSQLFDLIVEYPASKAPLLDIRRCLESTDALQETTQSLCSQLERRLLHPGASTSDILHHFVNTIQSLLLVDPHGYLLARATTLVRQYLRRQCPEAMTRLVELFTSPEYAELFALNGQQQQQQQQIDHCPGPRFHAHIHLEDASSDDTDDNRSETDADPASSDGMFSVSGLETRGQIAHRFAQHDILHILMGVCGGRERFIAEFQFYLARKLTTVMDYEFELLVRNLEVLKVRLGETSLNDADIMLKDISDSRRFMNFIRQEKHMELDSKQRTELVFISYLYWPLLCPEAGTHFGPPERTQSLLAPNLTGSEYFATLKSYAHHLNADLEQFIRLCQESFARQRAPRVLHWIPVAGVCDLELEFADGRYVEFTNVPLLNAMLLELFAEQPRWSRIALRQKLFLLEPGGDATPDAASSLPPYDALLQGALRFWSRHGILRLVDEGDFYEIVEHGGTEPNTREWQASPIDATQIDPIADALSAVPGPATEKIQDKDDNTEEVIGNYILGMLANFESLTLERMHQMLTMFCTDPPFRGTLGDVAACLNRLLDAGCVRYERGLYARTG